jgi:gluconate 5-dehydrogenase
MLLESLFSLAGKTVLLVGSSESLTPVISETLLESGAKVLLLGDTAHVVSGAMITRSVDLADRDTVAQTVAEIVQTSKIDVLINDVSQTNGKAGIEWVFAATKIVGDSMHGQGGSIINITVMDAVVNNGTLPPSIRGAALTEMMGRMAVAYQDVRVNSIILGPFSRDGQEQNALAERTCLRRTGHFAELRGPMMFLASNASSYMTGEDVVVDGGWTIL